MPTTMTIALVVKVRGFMWSGPDRETGGVADKRHLTGQGSPQLNPWEAGSGTAQQTHFQTVFGGIFGFRTYPPVAKVKLWHGGTMETVGRLIGGFDRLRAGWAALPACKRPASE
jgi:hypothetical protein